MHSYFGPIGKEYCAYFYVISIISGIFFVLFFAMFVIFIVLYFKRVDFMFCLNVISILFTFWLSYLANRVLHTMCVNSTF